MQDLYLVVRIAGQTVAIAAPQVGSVIEVGAITPVPRVARHVAGLFALRSHVLTVVDAQAALGFELMARDDVLQAVIVSVDGHDYALLVEAVIDVIQATVPDTTAAVLAGGWSRVAMGQIPSGDDTLLLIDATALIAGPEAMAA